MTSARATWAWVFLLLASCAQPRFEAPEVLDFGDVAIGARVEAVLVLRNPGGDDDALELLVPDGFAVEQTGFWLRAGAERSVRVTFSGRELGPREAALVVRGRVVERTVLLRARGVGPRLEVSSSVVLPPVPLLAGDTVKESRGALFIRNVGTGGSRLTVTRATASGPELCIGEFSSRVCVPAALPSALAAGDVFELPLTLRVTSDATRAWTVELQSDDPLQGQHTVQVYALIARVAPCEFSTTAVLPVGVNGALLRLEQRGAQRCFLRAMELDVTPAGALQFEAPLSLPRLVEPGEVLLRVIRRVPPAVFTSGTLRVSYEGGALDVALTPSTTGDPCVVLVPDALDFGFVAGGCPSASRSVQLYNLCSTPLAVIDATVLGADFMVTQFTPMTVVRSGGPPATLSVRMGPTDLGVRTGQLRITTSSSEHFVPLRGDVDPATRTVDRFRQGEDPSTADVLVVVDTSPSFAGARAAVRAGLAGALTSWTGLCGELRVGFVPAEADASVQLALNDAGAGWTGTRGPDFVGRALSAFDALPESSETEGCIGPAASTLLGLPDGGKAWGLCISDALEQSPSPQASLAALRGHFSSFQWDVVTGTSSSTCSVEANDDDLVHASLASAGGGQRVDVCSSWASHFTLGTFECGYRTLFYLTSTPRGVIEVRVDGQLVPAQGWTYDATLNAVNFEPFWAPRPNTLLEVSYDQRCTP